MCSYIFGQENVSGWFIRKSSVCHFLLLKGSHFMMFRLNKNWLSAKAMCRAWRNWKLVCWCWRIRLVQILSDRKLASVNVLWNVNLASRRSPELRHTLFIAVFPLQCCSNNIRFETRNLAVIRQLKLPFSLQHYYIIPYFTNGITRFTTRLHRFQLTVENAERLLIRRNKNTL